MNSPNVHRALVHVAHDRLGAQLEVGHPRLARRDRLSNACVSSSPGVRIRDLFERLHPLVVLDPLGLHRGDGLAACLELLRGEHRARIVEGRLDDRDDVERIVGRRRGSSSSKAASANGDSGWLSAKFGCRSTVSRMRLPSRHARPPRGNAACGRCRGRGARARSCRGHGSWLSKTRDRTCLEHVSPTGDDVDQHGARDLHAAARAARARPP